MIASRISEEVVKIFKYGQEDVYWNGVKVVNQIQEKALPIVQALYPGYQTNFIFDNAKSHAVFAKDALQVEIMSKGIGSAQSFLHNEWYEKNQQCQIQPMWYSALNSEEIEI